MRREAAEEIILERVEKLFERALKHATENVMYKCPYNHKKFEQAFGSYIMKNTSSRIKIAMKSFNLKPSGLYKFYNKYQPSW